MAFGGEDFSVMFTGITGLAGSREVEAIKSSLLTTTYHEDEEVDELAAAWFELDDSDTRMKYAGQAGNMYLYNASGDMNTVTNEPVLMIAQLPMDNVDDLRAFAEGVKAGLEQKGLTGLTYEVSSRDRINGYTAYETVGSGEINGNPITIMLQLIQQGDRLLMLQTIFKGGSETFDKKLVTELTDHIRFRKGPADQD